MQKIKNYIGLAVISMFLCACNTANSGENTPTATLTNQPEATVTVTEAPTPKATEAPTPTKDQEFFSYINSLDRIDWTEINCYVNEEDSIRNSNLLNYGYLTYDEEGNIYYVNENDGNIYMSDSNGENKRLLNGDGKAFGWLQLENNDLYYAGKGTMPISRIHLETGVIDRLNEKYSGTFTIDDGKIYFQDKAFSVEDIEGETKKQIYDSKGYINFFTGGMEVWISEIYGISPKTQNQNYLVIFDREKAEVLNQRGYFPLLAGDYFSIVSKKTKERHVYNLKTKQDINLEVETEKAVVSDGTNFYYSKWMNKGSQRVVVLYCWNGQITEELMVIEQEGINPIYHMFLTPEKLYYQLNGVKDGGGFYQMFYYDLATGETGQIF